MDHYADDLAAVTAHLDLQNAVHVGHSTGGGEVVHYLARHGESRAAKAVLISAVPPLMVQTEANPGGLPKDVFDGFQTQVAANRSQFYRDLAAGPFYGFNRPGVEASEAIIQNWWRQGMMGGAKAHYDGIVAFSQTDFTEDLQKISVPVLVMHGGRAAERGGGRRHPGRRCPIPAGPPPRPSGRGSPIQPPQVQRIQDHRGLQRPVARRDRPGHPLGRAAGGGPPDHAANHGGPVAATLGTVPAAWPETRTLSRSDVA
jgi:alpha/beta hydrolase fold